MSSSDPETQAGAEEAALDAAAPALGPASTPAAEPRRLVPPSTTTDEPVLIHVAGNKGYIYEIDDVKRLRVQHHICGMLIGTLPQVAQQNIFLGIPLQLLPEEIAVLVEYKLAVLVNSRGAHHQPTVAEAEEFYYKKRLQSIKEQQVMSQALGNEKRALMQEKYKEQIEKRRKEKEEEKRRKLDQAIAGGDVTVGLMGGEEEERTTVTTASTPTDEARKTSSDTVDATKTLTERPVEVGSDPKVPFTITIPGASDPALHTWYKPMHDHTPKYTTMADAHRVGLFTALDLTGNAMHRARVEVFKDLWLKGYFMGGGLKFGADFLVYPGDPLRYHSHFSTTVLATPTDGISPLDIVAWGRLATAVKKSHLMACYDEAAGEVKYLSLEWSGFG